MHRASDLSPRVFGCGLVLFLLLGGVLALSSRWVRSVWRDPVDALVQKARADFEAGRLEDARDILAKVLDDREDPAARALLTEVVAKLNGNSARRVARDYLSRGSYLAAATNFGTVLSYAPGDEEALAGRDEARFRLALAKARQELENRQYPAAIADCREALRIRNEHQEAKALLGQVVAAQRDAETDRLVAEGNAALMRKDWPTAIGAYQKAMASKPGDPAVLAKLNQARNDQADFDRAVAEGDLALGGKNYGGAIAAYVRALGKKPGDLVATGKLAHAHKEQDQADYEGAIARGDAALGRKEWQAAFDAFTRAQRKKPGDATAAMKFARVQQEKAEYDRPLLEGDAALARKDWVGAINAYTRALERRPGDPATTAKLNQARNDKADFDRAMTDGDAALARKDWQAAIDFFTAGQRKGTPDPLLAGRLARARQEKAEYDRAMKEGDEARGRKDWAAAINAYTRALALKPEDASTKLARARIDKADYDKAMADGDAALAKKDWVAAINAYTKALAKKPGDGHASSKLAQANAGKAKKDP